MALNKRQYVDGQTVITAANLNEIQDCIITLENNYVPKTRPVAGKALSSNITLAASDVGAVPTSRTINAKALTENIVLSAADVGAVPVARTVNGKALSSNITLSAADVSAVPTTRTVNGKALSSNITLASSDIGDDSGAGGSTVKESLAALNGAITNKTEFRRFTDMTANTQAALIASLTANMSSIPSGSSVLRIGDTEANGSRATVLCDKVNASTAKAFVVSPYVALNNIILKCQSGTWSVENTDYPTLKGKKIVIYGDSISDETSQTVRGLQPNWVAKARTMLPNTTITNKAVAGYPISGASNSISSIISAETAIDADIVIVFGGTNDFRHSVALGTEGTENSSTFLGSLEIIKNKFISLCPNAIVFFITPPKLNETDPPSDQSSLFPAVIYRAAMAGFCAKNGINLIDGYAFPLLNPFNPTIKTLYQSDGVHPLPAYAPIMAEYIVSKIVSGGDTHLAPQMTRIDISSQAYSGVNITFAYADFDSSGEVTITLSGNVSGTQGTNVDIIAIPDQLKSMTSGVNIMRQQIGSNFYPSCLELMAAKIRFMPEETGTVYFSGMCQYSTRFGGYNSNKA